MKNAPWKIGAFSLLIRQARKFYISGLMQNKTPLGIMEGPLSPSIPQSRCVNGGFFLGSPMMPRDASLCVVKFSHRFICLRISLKYYYSLILFILSVSSPNCRWFFLYYLLLVAFLLYIVEQSNLRIQMYTFSVVSVICV